jgi:hypothetical protein
MKVAHVLVLAAAISAAPLADNENGMIYAFKF